MWAIAGLIAMIGGYFIACAFAGDSAKGWLLNMLIGVAIIFGAWCFGDGGHASGFGKVVFIAILAIGTLAGASQKHGEY